MPPVRRCERGGAVDDAAGVDPADRRLADLVAYADGLPAEQAEGFAAGFHYAGRAGHGLTPSR